MASAPPVAALEAALKAVSDYKAPGVTGTRIAAMTSICVENVQYESVLIQKLFTYFKLATPPYKLGILYVVDSVVRKWLEQARSRQQAVDKDAADGTFAAGAYRLTALMPHLIDDMLRACPDGHKDKLLKLIEIWRKGFTFPSEMIESFQRKLETTPTSAPIQSHTPEGSPPPGLVERMGYNKPVAAPSAPAPMPAPDATNILANLQNLAKASQNQSHNGVQAQNHGQPQYSGQIQQPGQPQYGHQNQGQPENGIQGQNVAQPQNNSQVPINLQDLLSRLQNAAPQQQQQQQQQQPAPPMNFQQFPYSMPPFTSSTPTAPVPASFPLPFSQPVGTQFPGLPQVPHMPQVPQVPHMPHTLAGVTPNAAQQMAMFQTLLSQGVTVDKFAAMLAAVNGGQNSVTPAPSAPAITTAQSYYTPGQGHDGSAEPNGNRDQHRYNERARSMNRHQGRSRSRSPGRLWDPHGSSRGRHENGSDYTRRSPDRGRHDSRDSRRDGDYRQRSPPASRDAGRSNSSRRDSNDKWVEYDQSLPAGHIKVLSRTLFVGGVNSMPERQVREIFSQYGKVQTVIVNKEKRHAFVKMISRADAVRAKAAMEKLAEEQQHGDDQALRTRWGVGFGPRDASDYSNGVSIIPIAKLTEADCKWMLTAEYGGSGGRPIVPGLTVEEPDIEIGAGVSSKAISRRMQTDKSGNHGPRSTRGGRDESRDDPGRWRRNRDRDHRRDDRRDDNRASGANAQPLPQQFPFGIGTLPNGMPAYPPGFVFPASKGN